MVLNEILNTVSLLDKQYKVSENIKNTIDIIRDIQPAIIATLGYYKYYCIIRYFI